MFRFPVFCLVGLAIAVPVFQSGVSGVAAQGDRCSGDRADVKTLTDPSAETIDRDKVIGVNISSLAAFPVPDQLPAHSRFDPYETTIYTTVGVLVKARLDSDNAIELVVADPNSGDTITVIFPDPACAGGGDLALLDLMKQARLEFIRAYGLPKSTGFTMLSGMVALAGVGFINPETGREGEAPNGLEIHPALGIQAGANATSDTTTALGGASSTNSGSTPTGAAPHVYYVDTSTFGGRIYCDSDPALKRADQHALIAFRSLELALASYPTYRLGRVC